MYVDWSSNDMEFGARGFLVGSNDMRFEYALHFDFSSSNNEAEYEALIAGLRMANVLRAWSIQVYSDSQLIVNKTKEEYQANDPHMEKYVSKVQAHLA